MRRKSILSHLLLLSCVVWCAAQTSGDGISKNTYNVNDPKQTLAFMEKFFPCEQAMWSPECKCADGSYTCCPCGGLGRVAMDGKAGNTDDDEASGKGSGFQLHTVNATGRPFGDGLTPKQIDDIFVSKFSGKDYDSFMDFNTGLYVSNLDPYLKQLDSLSMKYYAVAWRSKGAGKDFTSVIFPLPGGPQVFVELFSDSQSILPRSLLPLSPFERVWFKEDIPTHYGQYWQNDSAAGMYT